MPAIYALAYSEKDPKLFSDKQSSLIRLAHQDLPMTKYSNLDMGAQLIYDKHSSLFRLKAAVNYTQV
jgi:hypothetical protein